jgi:hypothetical protein
MNQHVGLRGARLGNPEPMPRRSNTSTKVQGVGGGGSEGGGVGGGFGGGVGGGVALILFLMYSGINFDYFLHNRFRSSYFAKMDPERLCG